MIYLDNNATTEADPRVIDVIAQTMRHGPANASSLHRVGQRAAAAISDSIASIGHSLGITLDQPGGPRLIITSGGTESNNTAIHGIARESPLLISAIEHPSVIAAATIDQSRGRCVDTIAVTSDGIVDLDSLEKLLAKISVEHPDRQCLVAVMSANNETGIIQPIELIADLCRRHRAHLHVDATQTIGKIPFDLTETPIGSMSFAAHKFHGPAGVGGLWVAPGVQFDPIISGGGQQLESRGGTQPVALIVGMAHALKLATDEMEQSIAQMKRLRDRFESALLSARPELVIHGSRTPRLPQTTCVSMLGADRQGMLMALDIAGVAASSGSACSSGSSPPSHVLQAMGCPSDQIDSALRFGVSKFTTDADIDTAASKLLKCYARIGSSAASNSN